MPGLFHHKLRIIPILQEHSTFLNQIMRIGTGSLIVNLIERHPVLHIMLVSLKADVRIPQEENNHPSVVIISANPQKR